MKKLLIAILLASCLAASAGCGSNSSNNASSKTFEVDTDKYKDDGYIAISDIAYAKVTQTGDTPMINIVYLKNDPDEANCVIDKFFLTSLKDSDFTLTWNGKDYVIDRSEISSDATEDDVLSCYPKDLRESLKSGTHLTLPEETQNAISDDCNAVVKEYKDSLEKNNTSSDTESSSTELKRDTVSFSGGKMLMVLSQDDSGQKELYVSVDAVDDWSAYYSYFVISMIRNQNDLKNYKFTIISSFDSTVIMSSGLTMCKDGSVKSTSEYLTDCMEKYSDVSEEKSNAINQEIINDIVDFLYN